jgi:hypothetical protein
MPGRGSATFNKRQKEQRRKEKQREKSERRSQRKLEKQTNVGEDGAGSFEIAESQDALFQDEQGDSDNF